MVFAQVTDLREGGVPLLLLCFPGHRVDIGVLVPHHETLLTIVQEQYRLKHRYVHHPFG